MDGSSIRTLPRSSLSTEFGLPVHTRARRLGRLTRYAGLPSSTRNPMDRCAFSGEAMSCRMASNNVRMLSSCPATHRSSVDSGLLSTIEGILPLRTSRQGCPAGRTRGRETSGNGPGA
jgi:hypothetical protein